MFKKRYVFQVKMNCGHQKKRCQNGVGPDLTQNRQIVKRRLIKKWSFFEGVQKRYFTDPRLEIKMLILDKFYRQKMKLC